MHRITKLAVGVVPTLLFSATALAHSHSIERNGQVIGNGQNHPRFVDIDPTAGETFESCESYGAIAGSSIGAAWYGLETAHHGADADDPGKDDGCYMIEGGLSPLNTASDRNPAIK